jgi:hypothetical protein
LIQKSAAADLTPQEQTELLALQAALERKLEAVDDRLLAGLQRLGKAAEQLPEGPDS